MSRGIYSHELDDADFCWLINNFKANNPDHYAVELPGSPIVFLWIPITVEEEESTSYAVKTSEHELAE
jgi:hypothetical protein